MKTELRKLAKEKRANVDIEKHSASIKNILFDSEIYKSAKNVMCYYSFRTEVSTLKYFDDLSKNWFLPKIEGDNLLVCPYSKNMITNKYKIDEPQTQPVSPDMLDMVIIPALCADKNGYRIGYGKGYYDRFLKQVPNNVVRVVLTFSDLLFDDVCPDFYDEKCDYIVTEKNMLKIG